MKSSTWCGRLFGDYLINWEQGTWRSCCKMSWDQINSNGTSPWNNDLIIERQHAALNNIRHSDCLTCWKDEDNGLLSFRQTTASSKVMNRLILNLGNLCNLACNYCWPNNSSIWAAKLNKHPNIPDDIDSRRILFWKWWDDTGNNKIERVIITGGEPSLTEELYSWDAMANIFGKEILYNTNAAVNDYWWERYLDLLSKQSENNRIIVRVSMDAVGPQFEWIRTRLSWPQFEKNIYKLIKLAREKNILIRISPTLSCLSLESLFDVVKWVKENTTGVNDILEFDALSIISDPKPQRPMPWLCFFRNDLIEIKKMLPLIRCNEDFVLQLENLLNISTSKTPSIDERDNMIAALDVLENQWKKQSWRSTFSKIHFYSSQPLPGST